MATFKFEDQCSVPEGYDHHIKLKMNSQICLNSDFWAKKRFLDFFSTFQKYQNKVLSC